MANIKSAAQADQDEREAHRAQQGDQERVQDWIRKFREAADAGNDDEAQDAALAEASTKLDKAVSKGVIHKNQAANKKSSMAKKAAAL